MQMIPHSRPTLDEEEVRAVAAVVRSGRVSQGNEVRRFETELARQVDVTDAVAVSSGTAGLHLALVSLEVGAGDEVVIPSFVCAALLNAVRFVGAEPVPADIDPETFNIDARDVERRLTPRTKAIIVPHLFGLPADIRRIAALGVPVVEDCAQSLGSRLAASPIGSLGVLSVFSFYATKVICTGEGGMVASRDEGLLDRIRDLRDYDEKVDDRPRFNYKLTDLQAAIGIVQLRKLPNFIARRRDIAARYDDFMNERGIPGPVCPPDREAIPYRYVVRSERLEEILAVGRKAGIGYRRPVFKPLHHYLGLSGYPHTDMAFASALSIPLYPSLSDAEIEAILDPLRPVLSKKLR